MVNLFPAVSYLIISDGKKQRNLSILLDKIEQTRQRLYAAREEAERLLISQKLDVLLNRYYRLSSRR